MCCQSEHNPSRRFTQSHTHTSHVGTVAQRLRHTHVHMGSELHSQRDSHIQAQRQTLRRLYTYTHSTLVSPQQAESLQEGGETKVQGRSKKTGARDFGPPPSGVIGSRTGSLRSLPAPTCVAAASRPPSPHPRPPWSLPHVPPFSAATELERSPSRRAAESLRGSHSYLRVGGGWRGRIEKMPPTLTLGNRIPGFPQQVRRFRVSPRAPRVAGGGAVEGG